MLITNIGALQQRTAGTISVLIDKAIYHVSTSRRTAPQHPSLHWCGGTFSLQQAGTVDMYDTILVRNQPEQDEEQENEEQERKELEASVSGSLEKIRKTGRLTHGQRSYRFPENYFIAPEGFYQLEEQCHPSWADRNYVQLGNKQLEIRKFAFSIDDLVEQERRKKEQKESKSIAQEEQLESHSPAYNKVFLDITEMNHFAITHEMEQDAKAAVRGKRTEYDRGRAIFDLINRKVVYQSSTRWYQTAIMAYLSGRGNCAETAAIFVSMARSVGLLASWALVHVDCYGKDFQRERSGHACAVLGTRQGDVHSDNAYRRFDIKHRFCEKKDDYTALQELRRIFV